MHGKGIFHANGNDKKAEAEILSNKRDFKTKAIKIKKGTINDKRINTKEDLTLVNVYTPKYIKYYQT